MFVLAETRRAMIGADVSEAQCDKKAAPSVRPRRIPVASFLYRHGGKRLLDLMFCVMLIPMLAPFMLVMWVLIRRDGGPGFFVQPRIGRNGKVFSCYKFRTMVQGAEEVLEEMCAKDPKVAEEWRTYQKLHNDPRVSTVGRVLRATSLDELPQIFNVLRGDMSLVGPRPFLPSQQEIYDCAGGSAYYRMRPGVTGTWQVFGRSSTTFESRVDFDEQYARNVRLTGDLGLILRTADVVLRRTGR